MEIIWMENACYGNVYWEFLYDKANKPVCMGTFKCFTVLKWILRFILVLITSYAINSHLFVECFFISTIASSIRFIRGFWMFANGKKNLTFLWKNTIAKSSNYMLMTFAWRHYIIPPLMLIKCLDIISTFTPPTTTAQRKREKKKHTNSTLLY